MRIFLIAFLLGLATPLVAVEIGTARVNVLQELGPPAAALKRGDTETLNYKDGVRVVLKNGRVVEVTGLKTGDPAGASAPGEPAPAAGAEPAAEPDEPEEPPLTKEQAGELDRMEKEMADADAKARAEMEKAIMDMENAAEGPMEEEDRSFNITGFLIELLVKWLMTLAALKLACKYWNSDVPWNGLMLVSIVDVAVRGVIGFIGYGLLDMMSLFYCDEAVAALVMVGLLRKVSINQRFSLAVEVVLTTKVFSIVVGSFVVTVLMRTMF